MQCTLPDRGVMKTEKPSHLHRVYLFINFWGYIYQFNKGCHKGLSQQPDEKIHRARSQIKKLLFPWGLGPGSVAHGSIPVPQAQKLLQMRSRIQELSGKLLSGCL